MFMLSRAILAATGGYITGASIEDLVSYHTDLPPFSLSEFSTASIAGISFIAGTWATWLGLRYTSSKPRL